MALDLYVVTDILQLNLKIKRFLKIDSRESIFLNQLIDKIKSENLRIMPKVVYLRLFLSSVPFSKFFYILDTNI